MSEVLFSIQLKKILISLWLLATVFWLSAAHSQTSCSAQSVGDNFPTVSYSQNNGSVNWTGNWTEIGESDGVNAGIARVASNLCTSGSCLRLGVPSGEGAATYSNKGVYRQTNMSGASSATLSFVYRSGVNTGTQTIVLSVSNNGGSSWTTLKSYAISGTNTAATSESFDISAYTASNTQIRFLASGSDAENGMYIDDIEISYIQGICSATAQCGDTFVDAVTNNHVDGEIKFDHTGQLINNPDTILSTFKLTNKDAFFSCETAQCTQNNSVVPQLTGSFIDFTSGDSLQVDGNNSSSPHTIILNDYKDVTVKNGGSLYMSSTFSNYRFNKLKVESGSFIYLTPGDYFVRDIEITGASQLIVVGTGTARIYFYDDANFRGSSIINGGASGDPSKLVIYGYDINKLDDLKIEGGASIAGYIYTDGKIQIKDSSTVLGAISAAEKIEIKDTATVTYENSIDDTYFGDMCEPTVHFEIFHDATGFTCEAESMTIKACIGEPCNRLYTKPASITLSPTGWVGGDTIVFTGEKIISLSVTDESTISMAKTASTPVNYLTCFNGATETCDITFTDDGFEIYGANIGDPLPDQLAASNFSNVNLRAVRSNNTVCEALLDGSQSVNLTYNCISPNKCLTQLSGIAIDGAGLGDNTGAITVLFNDQGVASLSMLNYPDAGRLTLSVAAEVDGVTFNSSDNESVDVYPSYLKLAVGQSELLYGSTGAQNNYIAGKPFTFSIGAYGVNDALLPNYIAESPQLKTTRIQPASSGSNGNFKYSASGTTSALLAASFSGATGLSFSGGEHQYAAAYYDEVGRINVDVKDNTYLGNIIVSSSSLTLGDFYPAYFNVVNNQPTLADTCSVFSYIGENVGFETPPVLTIKAYNALDQITNNYSDAYWNYLPYQTTLDTYLSYADSSTYTTTGTASVVDLGDAPVVTSIDGYNGSGTVTINNGLFKYNKIDTDNSTFDVVSPFAGSIDLVFASDFFKATFVGQAGTDNVCFQDNYASGTCKSLTIDNVLGTEFRYGRLALKSTYGPETESLKVPIRAEYYNSGQWLLNTDDSCTSIAMTEAADQIRLTGFDGYDTDLIADVESVGELLLGVPVGDQLTLKGSDPSQPGPGAIGKLQLSLNPVATGLEWPAYLNYDWNGDGNIDTDDYPKATITFGLFRGNDRIIQWREVFN